MIKYSISTVQRCIRRIAFDFHGTIADTEKAVALLITKYYRTYKEMPASDVLQEMKDQVHTNADYMTQFVEPIPGSLELLCDLAEDKLNETYIVSSSDSDACNATTQWLNRRNAAYNAMITSGRGRLKERTLIPNMFDVFVENSFSEANAINALGAAQHVIILLSKDPEPGIEHLYRSKGLLTARNFADVRAHIARVLPSALKIA